MADRAEAAPWTDYPPTPGWYPPAVGLWGAALTLALGLLDSTLSRLLVVAGLVLVEGGFFGWYRRYRGTMPSGPLPRELRPAAAAFVVGLLAVVVAGGTLVLLGLAWVAAAVVLVAATGVVWSYERAYAAAMAATKARLA